MDDSIASYTTYRITLISGILGSLGALVAWVGWLALRLPKKELLLTAGAGLVLGYALHWIRLYVVVARRESVGESTAAAQGVRRSRKTVIGLVWGIGFAFLGLVTEHLAAEMATKFLLPLLASLATMLPAGMILGRSMSQGRAPGEQGFMVLLSGLGTGVGVGVVTGIIWTLGFGTAPWLALISWWALIGWGMRIATRKEPQAVRILDPIKAVVLIFLVTLGLNQLPTTYPAWLGKLGPIGNVPVMLRLAAEAVQESPGLPATFWKQAQERYVRDSIVKAGGKPGPVTVVPETEGRFGTEFRRSWLVMLLFAGGIGLAPWTERRLRPVDYPNSETYRNDIILTIVTVLTLISACVVARMYPDKEPARVEATP